jgi:hypothetical protein
MDGVDGVARVPGFEEMSDAVRFDVLLSLETSEAVRLDVLLSLELSDAVRLDMSQFWEIIMDKMMGDTNVANTFEWDGAVMVHRPPPKMLLLH